MGRSFESGCKHLNIDFMLDNSIVLIVKFPDFDNCIMIM